MAKINKVERILKKHYEDMLNLNKDFIQAIARPRPTGLEMVQNGPKSTRKLTKKQLKALDRGRKILRRKRLQIAKG